MEYDNIFIKQDVSIDEYNLCNLAKKAVKVPTPDIIHYDRNSETMKLVKLRIPIIAEKYGDEDKHTPKETFKKIRKIVKKLWDCGICYPDITSYNFLEDEKGFVYIIDFGHAFVHVSTETPDQFVMQFLRGHNGWNPDFA